MGESNYLIDTNAVIDYLGNKLPNAGMTFMHSIIDAVPIVSVITKIELLGFNTSEQHSQLLIDFIKDATVLDLNSDVVDACIAIRKKHKIKLPDAIIAASAIVFDLVLISRNSTDFNHLEGLRLINPHGF